ncbi:hypothetical protein [Streptomyces longispororuber]|uniref:hypothetical protein n=1 Tax=Streptomyces longispororuber TaxID=68230 RepID=UPI002109591C|nr:hypothetical protein [Streptomyces longispororuber]MCQ4213887.1 hypothetical protein [Streptomyces longispororuber]
MSGDEQQQPGTGAPEELPAPKDLATPEELTDGQVAMTNIVQTITGAMHDTFGIGSGRAYQYGKQASYFEEHPLNNMLDMVENTKPSHLEEAGHALWRASKSINDAAEELRTNIKNAGEDWKGEAGTSFETWGAKLAGTTEKLATYVELAGVQVSAAATGLASVKSSMPKTRDTRNPVDRKRPEQLSAAKQTESDPEYAEAVRVEKDRQEAINQMNRLASFYSVSAEGLQTLQSQEPTFEMMPNVGVPKPQGLRSVSPGGDGGATTPGHTGGAPSAGHTGGPVVEPTAVPEAHSDVKEIHGSVTSPDRPVGTAIDSVGTLPPPTLDTPVTTTPTATGPGSGNAHPTAPFPTGFTNTSVPRATSTGKVGIGGQGKPYNAPGRTGGGPSPQANRGATNNPLGRPSSTSRTGARGATEGGRPTATGRGISGGTPRAATSATGRGNGLGNAGANRTGVVGGRPTSNAPAAGKGGQRTARGVVVGGEPQSGSRSGTGQIGQRGVVGAPNSKTAGAKSPTGGRTVQGASQAVTGKPTGKSGASRTGRSGFTSGGSGLVRGPGRNQKPGEPDEEEGTQRPDYLVEDEETHLPDAQRRNVPPVIN